MTPPPWVRMSLAGLAIAAGCASPAGVEVPLQHPGWKDTGTPAVRLAQEREVRYYRDENGIAWDDRGRKHGPAL